MVCSQAPGTCINHPIHASLSNQSNQSNLHCLLPPGVQAPSTSDLTVCHRTRLPTPSMAWSSFAPSRPPGLGLDESICIPSFLLLVLLLEGYLVLGGV